MDEVAALTQRIETLEQEREQFRQLYLEMLERCRKLERGLLGQQAEKLPDDSAQLSFQVLGQMLGDKAQREVEQLEPRPVKAHTRKPPTGRKPLPENLPRVDIEIVPEEVKQLGLEQFERIGEEVTEVLERRPASAVVARIIKPKFVRKDKDVSVRRIALVGAVARGACGAGDYSRLRVRAR
jgi:hypothetical protein